MQANPFLLSKKDKRDDSFWKFASNEQYLRLRDFAMKICSMFGSTYICESTFSSMKRLKSKERNRMGNETLDDCLRLSTTEIEPNIETVTKSKNQ